MAQLGPKRNSHIMDMTPHFPIYMDYGATTPCDPRVVDVMVPWLHEHFGNPASRSHAWGWEAEEAVEKARQQVADLVGADPREIVWTSGATSSPSRPSTRPRWTACVSWSGRVSR